MKMRNVNSAKWIKEKTPSFMNISWDQAKNLWASSIKDSKFDMELIAHDQSPPHSLWTALLILIFTISTLRSSSGISSLFVSLIEEGQSWWTWPRNMKDKRKSIRSFGFFYARICGIGISIEEILPHFRSFQHHRRASAIQVDDVRVIVKIDTWNASFLTMFNVIERGKGNLSLHKKTPRTCCQMFSFWKAESVSISFRLEKKHVFTSSRLMR